MAATFPDPGTTVDDPGTGGGGGGGVDEGAVQALIDASLPVAATTTTAGIVELATTGETTTGTDATRAVTPAGAKALFDALVGLAPAALDTLIELAAALGNDASFAATMTTALAGKQASNANLSALAGLTLAADRVPYSTGAGALALATQTAFARTLLDDVDAATALATLGAQPADADLTQIAGLTSAADKLPYSTGAQAWALTTFTAAGRALVDDADAAAQRTTLGLQHSIPSPDDTVTGEVVLGAAAMAALISGATTVAGRVYFVVGA